MAWAPRKPTQVGKRRTVRVRAPQKPTQVGNAAPSRPGCRRIRPRSENVRHQPEGQRTTAPYASELELLGWVAVTSGPKDAKRGVGAASGCGGRSASPTWRTEDHRSVRRPDGQPKGWAAAVASGSGGRSERSMRSEVGKTCPPPPAPDPNQHQSSPKYALRTFSSTNNALPVFCRTILPTSSTYP